MAPGLERGPGRALGSTAMTWLWSALIAVGVVMIAVALWPSRKGGGTPAPGEGDGTTERPDDHRAA